MSYKIYMVHWKVFWKDDPQHKEKEERFSFHENEQAADLFIKATILDGLRQKPKIVYTVKVQHEITHAPGALYDEVRTQARESKRMDQKGIWKTPEELAAMPL